ncbi:MAG TPA: type II secretion system F family protein [Patescibacteria group bacterium]|nr:type II secretion system F family protein [Patescibacteria group bacterium]
MINETTDEQKNSFVQSVLLRTDGLKQKLSKSEMFLRFPLQEQILFAKRLSLLVKAGVPIMQALNMLHKQTKSKSAQLIFSHLLKGVEQGQNLSSTLRNKYERLVGEFTINIIEVGEVSGTLQQNLLYLADELQKKQALRRKVVNAMVYPVFIVVATVGITILLTVFVFPKILPIFASFPSFQLPITTRILIFVSHAMLTYWYLFLIGTVAVIGGFIGGMRTKKFRRFIHQYILKVPVFGGLLKSYYLATICRTFGILLKSNVPIVKAVNITAQATTNVYYREKLVEVADYIKEGGQLSAILLMYPKIFPALTAQMVEVGETTGSLSNSLMFLSDMYENEVDDITKNLSSVMEPALMVFIGLLVGFVAISIITPIYSFTQNLHPR